MPALGLAALAVVAPQLLGGATPETDLAILTLGLCASGFAAWTLRRDSSGPIPLAALAAWLASGWTLIQIIPLPCSFVARFWPERADIAQELMALGALKKPVCTLSLAPGATLAALAQATVLTSVMLSAVSVARTGQARILTHGVALSSVTMAVAALGHLAFNANAVYGLYEPKHATPGLLLAPLLNGNNLAGLLALGLPACIALGLQTERIDLRVLWFAAVFVVATTAIFTLSRGGAAAICLGAGGYLSYRRLRRRGNPQKRSGRLITGVALSTAAGLTAILGMDVLADQLQAEGTSLSKLEQSFRLSDLLKTHALTGIGRGALLDASVWVLNENTQMRYAENLPIQWVVDWGIPIGTTVAVGFAVSLGRGALAAFRDHAALCFGLLAIVVQNMVDYSLEVSGVAIVAAVAAGPVLASAMEMSVPIGRLRAPSLSLSLTGSTLAATASWALALPVLTVHARANVRSDLMKLVDRQDEGFEQSIEQALPLYPFDPELVLLGSAHAVRVPTSAASRWLNLAMRMAPGWAAPHEQAAYWLERIGHPTQAAIELGLARERKSTNWTAMACELVLRHGTARIAYESVGRGLRREEALDHVQRCLSGSNRKERRALAQKVLTQFPNSVVAGQMLIRADLEGGNVERAISGANASVARNPQDPQSWEGLLLAYSHAGRAAEALERLQQAPRFIRSDQAVLAATAQAAAAARQPQRLSKALEELLQRHGRSSSRRARLYVFASRIYRDAGDHLAAATHAQRAYELSNDPTHAELTYHYAVRAGVTPLASHMAAQLCHVGHRVDVYCPEMRPPRPEP